MEVIHRLEDWKINDPQLSSAESLCRRSFRVLALLVFAFLETGGSAAAQPQHPGDWGANLRYGYIDARGRTIVAPRFDLAQDFHEGLAAVCFTPPGATGPVRSSGRRCGFINRSGAFVVPPVHRNLGSFFEGRAWFKAANGSYGYLDRAGGRAVAARFTMVDDFHGGLAAVALSPYSGDCRCVGFIDQNGDLVIPPKFDAARAFSEGLAAVRLGRQWGFVSRNGDVAIAASYDDVGDFSEGLAAFRLGSLSGFINRHGQIEIPAAYGPRIGRFSEGLAHVILDGHAVFIDHTGRVVVAPSADDASDFSEGLAAVYTGRHAYIDHDGNRIVNTLFDYAANFRGGLAAVHLNGKWGYIDRAGRVAIPPRFADFPVYDPDKGFSEGLALFAVKRSTRASGGSRR